MLKVLALAPIRKLHFLWAPAITVTSEKFLRPGKPNLSKRLVAAEDIFNRYNEQYGSQSDKEV